MVIQWIKKALSPVTDWVRTDGLLHIAVSALIVIALGWIRPVWIAAAVALSIGICKEIYDRVSGEGVAEWHDVLCDLLGIAVGLLFIFINSLPYGN